MSGGKEKTQANKSSEEEVQKGKLEEETVSELDTVIECM